MLNKPFIKLFCTSNNRYAYDVNSSEIIKLNIITYEYLNYLQSCINEIKIRELLYEQYETKYVDENCDFINGILKNGVLFSSDRPKQISMFCCNDKMEYYYNNYVNQLIFEVTRRCNFACKYCVFSGIYKDYKTSCNSEMTWEIAKSGLDFMFVHGGKDPSEGMYKKIEDIDKYQHNFAIGFYGGEPLLNFGLLKKCILYVKKHLPDHKNVQYTVTTNGSLLTEEIFEFLYDNNVHVVLSLDGPQPIHDRARIDRYGNGTHAYVMKAINIINSVVKRKKRHELYTFFINCVVVGGVNYKDLFDYFLSLADQIDNPFVKASVGFSPINKGVEKWNESYPAEKLNPAEGFDDLVDDYIRKCRNGVYSGDSWQKDLSLKMLHEIVFKSAYFDIHSRSRYQFSDEFSIPDVSFPGSICKLGTRRPYLLTDGTILPCERLPTGNPCFYIGHIRKGFDLNKIRQTIDDFTNATIDDCRECWCYRFCSVGCIDEMDKKKKCTELRNRRERELVGMMELLESNPHSLDHYNAIEVD